MRASGRQAGQALPLALAVGVLVLLGAVAVFVLGRVQLAGAQAQSAADLAAVSAGREMRSRLGEMAVAGEAAEGTWRERLTAAAREAAEPVGARVESLQLVGESWPPLAVEVVVSRPGPRDTTVRAVARAGIVLAAAPGDDGRTGWATGGGYSGPLVYRDGKPMCPAVAAAFDLMDAAARAAGIDLVVNSAFRSDAEQAILFRRHPDPRWVAPPGRSRHRDSTELDINMGDGGRAHAWLRANGGAFGFVQRYSWEPWHWGYVPGCGGAGAAAPAGASVGLPEWVPARYRAQILSASLQHGLPPALLAALLRAESGFDPTVVSSAGAQGIAQFMPATAREVGLSDPFDPDQAIPAAAALLAGHMRTFGSASLALAAYNAGPGAVRRYGGVPPYAETQAYVVKVMALAGGAAALGSGPGGDGVVLMRVPGRNV